MGRGRWVLVGVAATVVVLVGAVGWFIRTVPGECPAAGCTSTVVFDLTSLDPEVRRDAASAEICMDGSCEFQMIIGNQQNVRMVHDDRTVGTGSVTITDSSGAELQRLELTHEVEGADVRRFDESCLPACWSTSLVARDGALEPKT